MCRHKLIDVSVCHPLRYHSESTLSHYYPQQRQHVRMPKGSPSYDLFAEPLQTPCSVSRCLQEDKRPPMTYVSHTLGAIATACPQNLDRDLPVTMPMLRHVREPTATHYDTNWIIV